MSFPPNIKKGIFRNENCLFAYMYSNENRFQLLMKILHFFDIQILYFFIFYSPGSILITFPLFQRSTVRLAASNL